MVMSDLKTFRLFVRDRYDGEKEYWAVRPFGEEGSITRAGINLNHLLTEIRMTFNVDDLIASAKFLGFEEIGKVSIDDQGAVWKEKVSTTTMF
jgi:hypothetical protein